MKTDRESAKDIDEYIAKFSANVQVVLKQIRATIKKAAPDAEEAIKYQIPTFVLNGNLVHFAAFKDHIGFYPTPSGIEAFKQELSGYKSAKGSVQFPLAEPMPLILIDRIVRFRVEEAISKSKTNKIKQMEYSAVNKLADYPGITLAFSGSRPKSGRSC